MNTTVVIVSYNSDEKVFYNLDKFNHSTEIIIIENSNDHVLKDEIERNYKNVRVIMNENKGFGQAANLGAKIAKNKYIFFCSPDNFIENNTIQKLEEFTKEVDDYFGVLVVNEEGSAVSKLTEVKMPWRKTEKGIACFFVKKEIFLKISGFDENFFLYCEDKDLSERLVKAKFPFYKVPLTFKNGKGSHNKKYNYQISINNNWHFMWSKFYYKRKQYGYLIALLITLPYFANSCIKVVQFLNNPKNSRIYIARINGLINAYFLKKAWFRPNLTKYEKKN